ncbi:cytochrome c [bacterium]|nr:cytochrome c [bacterium]
MRNILIFLAIAGVFAAPCFSEDVKTDVHPATPIKDQRFHQFFQYSKTVYSGAEPEDAATFAAMKEYGINTIISVDGAQPDVEEARKNGIQYIHLPFGYDGIPKDVSLRLAKAVEQATGNVYFHCHHGKHRGPSGAAMALTLLGEWKPAVAIEAMKQTGTSPNYKGLYQCVGDAHKLSKEALDAIPADFPAIAPVKPLVAHMAGASRAMEHLGLVKAAGWTTLADHPDVDPPHEALQLREHLTESARLEESKKLGDVFMAMMKASVKAAEQLEKQLREDPMAHSALDKNFDALEKSCKTCHDQYRNVPHETK